MVRPEQLAQRTATMKKFPIFAALALLLAGFCSGHAQAATPKADCLLIVNNKPLI
jgi:hypothetical protein